jgi:hypothetical protein
MQRNESIGEKLRRRKTRRRGRGGEEEEEKKGERLVSIEGTVTWEKILATGALASDVEGATR